MTHRLIIDLCKSTTTKQDVQCDVCIVGAGAAGLYTAVRLAAVGIDVVLLEAGSASCADSKTLDFRAQFSADVYAGATNGRAFGLGGSTSRWGGTLVPHSHNDVRNGANNDLQVWEYITRTVSQKTEDVLRALGWRHDGDFYRYPAQKLKEEMDVFNAHGIEVSASLCMPFRKKNFFELFQPHFRSYSTIRIYANAVANAWSPFHQHSETFVRHVRAQSVNGNCVEVNAKHFIVAAGALESARILLELAAAIKDARCRLQSSCIGSFLSDHLSLPIADVTDATRSTAVKLFAPRFSHGWMRTFRLIENAPPANAPRAFAHFIFQNDSAGFLLAKEVLGAIQGRYRPRLSAPAAVRGIGGLTAIACKRYFRSTLHIPRTSKCHLQLDVEQAPNSVNKIRLSDNVDSYGRRKASIYWRISPADLDHVKDTAIRLLNMWPNSSNRLPVLKPRNLDFDTVKPYDAYHPVGVCRMGSHSDSVVDLNLKVHGTTNLWVVSTGVLPSAGTANPTFSMLCLAENLVEHFRCNLPKAR